MAEKEPDPYTTEHSLITTGRVQVQRFERTPISNPKAYAWGEEFVFTGPNGDQILFCHRSAMQLYHYLETYFGRY